MPRSMYSLMLSDDIVREIDQLANTQGTSRSGLINRILADHLGMLTPERWIQQVYDHANRCLSGCRSLAVQSADTSIFSVRGTLDTKYNPIIRYDVLLTYGERGYTGELRVVSRSQSETLLHRLNVFFEIWSQVEQAAIGDHQLTAALRPQITSGRLKRQLLAPTNSTEPDSGQVGEAIGGYLRLLDQALSIYFSAPSNGMDIETYTQMLKLYKNYLKHAKWFI